VGLNESVKPAGSFMLSDWFSEPKWVAKHRAESRLGRIGSGLRGCVWVGGCFWIVSRGGVARSCGRVGSMWCMFVGRWRTT